MVTFEQLLKIIRDTGKTDHQKAADLHALLIGSDAPAPKPAGKKRGRKPKDANGVQQETGDGVFGGEPPA